MFTPSTLTNPDPVGSELTVTSDAGGGFLMGVVASAKAPSMTTIFISKIVEVTTGLSEMSVAICPSGSEPPGCTLQLSRILST
jgi:hypothetical protein